MPKGVEHYSCQLRATRPSVCRSQRCRKALSTWHRQNRQLSTYQVPKSEMPKGVEHCVPSRCWHRQNRVPKSEMPKGVEHADDSVTPAAGSSAEVRDAERR